MEPSLITRREPERVRLIDANALIKAMKNYYDGTDKELRLKMFPWIFDAISITNSAPTVDVIKDVVGFVNDWVEENLDEWWSACDYFEDMTKDLKWHFNNV